MGGFLILFWGFFLPKPTTIFSCILFLDEFNSRIDELNSQKDLFNTKVVEITAKKKKSLQKSPA